MKKTKISTVLALVIGSSWALPAYADDATSTSTTSATSTAAASSALPASGATSPGQPVTGGTHTGLTAPGPTPHTVNAIVNEEAKQNGQTAAALSSQAKSKGFLADSHLGLVLRNYADYAEIHGTGHRHAWVQSAMLNYESGFTRGLVGFGVDASLYGAFKLDGGLGAGNMVHVAKSGNGANQLAWGYPGVFDVKARVSETVVKYGEMQITDNPLMEGHDNRSLPPTFRGVMVTSNEFKNLSLEAGSFDGVRTRGTDYVQKLSTSYGGTTFDRLTYIGGNWKYAKDGTLSLYADQAENVWKQYYGSLTQSLGDVKKVKWTGVATAYSTHGDGSNLQGSINNNAYSVSLAAQHGFSEILLAYQKILGNQFFDYVAQTNGIYLANSMDMDYNAPHEQSLQLRYTFYGDQAGIPGFKTMVWALQGWGADSSAEAAANAATTATYHDLYWDNGSYIHGRHHEFGIMPTYTVQNGRMKGTKVSAFFAWHVGSAYYSDTTSKEFRLVVNMPFSFF
ncbi:MAG: OprD family outer membrane porin [Janthinobacterium lividum]